MVLQKTPTPKLVHMAHPKDIMMTYGSSQGKDDDIWFVHHG